MDWIFHLMHTVKTWKACSTVWKPLKSTNTLFAISHSKFYKLIMKNMSNWKLFIFRILSCTYCTCNYSILPSWPRFWMMNLPGFVVWDNEFSWWISQKWNWIFLTRNWTIFLTRANSPSNQLVRYCKMAWKNSYPKWQVWYDYSLYIHSPWDSCIKPLVIFTKHWKIFSFLGELFRLCIIHKQVLWLLLLLKGQSST